MFQNVNLDSLTFQTYDDLEIPSFFDSPYKDVIFKGFAAKLVVEEYSDSLVSSNELKLGTPRCEKIDPCMNLRLEWSELINLIKKVQTHGKCDKRYCRKGQNNSPCRFKFPHKLRSRTNLEITKIDGKRIPLLSGSRNNALTNYHNPSQLAILKANCDIRLILTRGDYIEYISKYCTKSEPLGESFPEIVRSITIRSLGVSLGALLQKSENPL